MLSYTLRHLINVNTKTTRCLGRATNETYNASFTIINQIEINTYNNLLCATIRSPTQHNLIYLYTYKWKMDMKK
jgi:hypothetical protein